MRRQTALLGCIACLLLAGAAGATVGAPPAPPAAAFDAQAEELESTALPVLGYEQAAAELDGLAALLSPGDVARELRLRGLRCDWAIPGPDARLAAADAGLADARAAGDHAATARFHYCRATALDMLGRGGEPILAEYEAGLAAARRSGDLSLVADGLSMLGSMRSFLGDQASAIPELLAAMRLYRQAGLDADAEYLLLDIGTSFRRMGESAKAREYLAQSTAFAERQEDWVTVIASLLQSGFLEEDDGDLVRARAHYQRALALAREHDSTLDAAGVQLAMSWPAIAEGRHADALALLDAAEAGFAAHGDRSNEDMVALRRGQALAGLGRHREAMVQFGRAAATLERTGNQRYLALLHLTRARSHRALGDAAAAYADLERHVAISGRITTAERSQQSQLLRRQFESDRRDLENTRLANETALRERQVEALLEARRWQWTAVVLAAVLVVLLVALVARQLQRMRRLRELAATDPLTGVANRRSIERFGEEAIAAAREAGDPLCVLLLDIDHFKQVNDRFGHLTGDQVLARIAAACSGALRQQDRLGRIGGEEFLVLLPQTGMAQARQVAERIRGAVEVLAFEDVDPSLRLSISIGISELGDEASLRELCARADSALYAAKDSGRNRIVAAA